MHEERGRPSDDPQGAGRHRVVVFAGGGTGGHLYPALALADALAGLRPDVRPFFVGARRGLEARVLPQKEHEHLLVPIRGMARGGGLSNWRILPALWTSVRAVFRLFRRVRPELVVVTGGYAGAPAGVVAVLRRVPLALQEQNAVPGVTTRLLSRWARQIHLAFPEAAERLPSRARSRVAHAGNPIQAPAQVDQAAARRHFGLAPDGPVVLVVGGSQGSEALNRVVAEAVGAVEGGDRKRPDGLQLLWATGPKHLETVLEALGGRAPGWVRPVDYIHEMPLALGVADVTVSRAGAMATSEFLAWGVPMVLVPLPTAAADHQTHNARTLEEAGAALHLTQSGLTAGGLWDAVTELVGSPERLARYRKAALARGRPDAAREIATELARLLPPLDARNEAPGDAPGTGGRPGASSPGWGTGGALEDVSAETSEGAPGNASAERSGGGPGNASAETSGGRSGNVSAETSEGAPGDTSTETSGGAPGNASAETPRGGKGRRHGRRTEPGPGEDGR